MNNKVIGIGVALLAIGFWLLNTAGGRDLQRQFTSNVRSPNNSSPCPQKPIARNRRQVEPPVGGHYGNTRDVEQEWEEAETWEE